MSLFSDRVKQLKLAADYEWGANGFGEKGVKPTAPAPKSQLSPGESATADLLFRKTAFDRQSIIGVASKGADFAKLMWNAKPGTALAGTVNRKLHDSMINDWLKGNSNPTVSTFLTPPSSRTTQAWGVADRVAGKVAPVLNQAPKAMIAAPAVAGAGYVAGGVVGSALGIPGEDDTKPVSGPLATKEEIDGIARRAGLGNGKGMFDKGLDWLKGSTGGINNGVLTAGGVGAVGLLAYLMSRDDHGRDED